MIGQPGTQAFSSHSLDSTWCQNVVTSPNEVPGRGMPFGEITKFRAKSCEREEKAWVLGCD